MVIILTNFPSSVDVYKNLRKKRKTKKEIFFITGSGVIINIIINHYSSNIHCTQKITILKSSMLKTYSTLN